MKEINALVAVTLFFQPCVAELYSSCIVFYDVYYKSAVYPIIELPTRASYLGWKIDQSFYIDDTHTVERQGIILFYTKCLKDYNKHLPYTHKIQTQKENLEKPQPQKQSIMGLG